jgi:pimeloyl-ACP methyl ester carboxylesterase
MKGHRIVAPDLLGYGESDAPDIQYAIPEQSAMVMDLLDSLRLAQVDLLGFSMGGWVALTLTRDHPERVRRLVLVGSGGLRFPTNVTPAFFVPTSLEQFRAIEQAQSGRRTPDFLARDLVRTSEARAWALLRSGTSLLSFRDALDGHLATIETPTLLIWGEGDRLIPYDVGQRMAHELPHARLVGLPGVRPFGAMGVRGSSAPRGAQLSPVMAWRGEAALCSLCAVVRPMRRDSEA